jgi:hypothetical protein
MNRNPFKRHLLTGSLHKTTNARRPTNHQEKRAGSPAKHTRAFHTRPTRFFFDFPPNKNHQNLLGGFKIGLVAPSAIGRMKKKKPASKHQNTNHGDPLNYIPLSASSRLPGGKPGQAPTHTPPSPPPQSNNTKAFISPRRVCFIDLSISFALFLVITLVICRGNMSEYSVRA